MGIGSVGGAAAQGLESGLGIAMRFREQSDRMADREEARTQRAQDMQWRSEDRALRQDELALNRERQAKTFAREDMAHAQGQEDRQITAAQSIRDALRVEGEGLVAQYGSIEAVPPELQQQFFSREQEATKRYFDLQEAKSRPRREAVQRSAQDLASYVAAGKRPLEDLSDDEMGTFIVGNTRLPATDFLPGPNGRSRVHTEGIDKIEAGLKTGNQDLLLEGANYALAQEVQKGVGGPGRGGFPITSKRISQFAPHPDPELAAQGIVAPVLDVTIDVPGREGGLTYKAWATQGRNANGQDLPIELSVESLMKRVQELSTLADAATTPTLAPRFAAAAKSKGAQEAAQAFGMSLAGLGGVKPRKIKREVVNLGGTAEVLTIDEATGKVVGKEVRERTKVGGGRASGSSREDDDEDFEDSGGGGGGGRSGQLGLGPGKPNAKIKAIEYAVRQGHMTPEQGREAIRQEAGISKGKAKTLDDPKAAFDAENKLRDEHTKASGSFVKINDAYRKVQAASKDPTPASDIALIFGYMKILDPESVVREGEFATAQNAGSVGDRVVNLYNRALEGTRLNEKQRADMVREAEKVMEAQRKGQTQRDKTYIELAERYGLEADNVVQPFGEEPEEPSAPGAPPAAGLKAVPAPAQGAQAGPGAVKPAVDLGASKAPGRAAQQIAVNPKTGQRLVLRNGQWQPMQ